MHPTNLNLIFCLQLVALVQLSVALLNLALPRLLRWKEDLERMPLLIREVFYVHAWFISVTLAIFGVMTWRFAEEMSGGTNAVGGWLAVAIGVFWAVRAVLQVTYYSSSHWRGKPGRTAIHITLLIVYGGMACVYLGSAFAGTFHSVAP